VIRATVLVNRQTSPRIHRNVLIVWRRSHFELWVPKRACWPT